MNTSLTGPMAVWVYLAGVQVRLAGWWCLCLSPSQPFNLFPWFGFIGFIGFPQGNPINPINPNHATRCPTAIQSLPVVWIYWIYQISIGKSNKSQNSNQGTRCSKNGRHIFTRNGNFGCFSKHCEALEKTKRHLISVEETERDHHPAIFTFGRGGGTSRGLTGSSQYTRPETCLLFYKSFQIG